jgi:transposase
MKITTVGIDLAENVFQVHALDERGKPVLRKQLRRAQVAAFFGNLPPCVIGMEACASAHHWGRTLQCFGHTVRLMAPQFVKPYLKTNKNDAADAEAICEAVGRLNMRFVPIKSVEQQAGRPIAVTDVRQVRVDQSQTTADGPPTGSDRPTAGIGCLCLGAANKPFVLVYRKA